MLELTNHVLVDVGIHTITAFAGVESPAQVTPQHLDAIADQLAHIYASGIGRSLSQGIVFPNSGFTRRPSTDQSSPTSAALGQTWCCADTNTLILSQL